MHKSQNITIELRNNILTGTYADGKLPGERILANTFKVGRCTVRSALQTLEDEGLVERRTKSGTFIKIQQKTGPKGIIGLFARTEGHFFKELYESMISTFARNGYLVQSFSTNHFDSGKKHESLRNKMKKEVKKLLAESPAAIIMDGYCNGQIPLKKEIMKLNPIVYNYFDSREKYTPKGVWFDFKAVGYMAGKYLVEHGCTKPLLISHYVPLAIRLDNDFYPHHREKQLIDGFKKAISEAGLSTECCVLDCFAASLKDYQSTLDIFCRSNYLKPDGICGSSDRLTVDIMNKYNEYYETVPKDIFFMGICNTPWSRENPHHPFTTIDLNPDGVAEAILKQVRQSPEKRKNIFIKPILREYNQQHNNERRKIF